MSSSKSYELTLTQGEQISMLHFSSRDIGDERSCNANFRSDRPLILRLSGPEDELEVRVRIGTDVVGYLSPQLTSAERNIQGIVGELFGEAELILEARSAFAIDANWNQLFVYLVPLTTPRETVILYQTIIRELEAAHPSLARDFMGRAVLRSASANAGPFEPALECDDLTYILEELSSALEKIGQDPLTAATITVQAQRWRPGDRLDIRAVQRSCTQWAGPRPELVAPRRVNRPRFELSTDVDEHRHLRSALLGLARRCDRLREDCHRAAELIRAEERTWGLRRAGSISSVYEERYAPRVDKLRQFEAEAIALGRGFRSLLNRYRYIVQAGRPRRALGPTPAFLERKGYRDAYRILLDLAQRNHRATPRRVELRLRRLDLLYEYWCFVCCISLLTERLGPPDPGSRFRVVDDVYRPELLPGQCFVWSRPDGSVIRAYYEPAIPPFGHREIGPFGWRASLVGAPVRPDTVIVLQQGEDELRALVLDAKSTTRFDRRSLAGYTDYRTLVHDPERGIQPIRQVFFVHRDPKGHFSTFPGHFEGKRPPMSTSVIGAIPLLPTRREDLMYVMDSFLGDPYEIGPALDTPTIESSEELDPQQEDSEDEGEEMLNDDEFATGAPTAEDELDDDAPLENDDPEAATAYESGATSSSYPETTPSEEDAATQAPSPPKPEAT